MVEFSMVEVFVSRLGLDSDSGSYVVVLQEKNGDRMLPIWIGKPEAESIVLHMHNVKRARPLTHDLVRSLIQGLGAKLRRACITRVEDRTYFAELELERDDTLVKIDARPSDSIAIALRLSAPIFAADGLLAEPASDDDATDDDDDDDEQSIYGSDDGAEASGAHSVSESELTADQLKRYLEALRPEDFGKFNP